MKPWFVDRNIGYFRETEVEKFIKEKRKLNHEVIQRYHEKDSSSG